ncbi:MAG: PhnD/SsuA/transferrin family substrate-binding protein [Pseudomonadota bacterium]
MYDWPEVQGRTDAFWAAVRASLPADLAAPEALSRPGDLSAPWRDPGLVLGQTCGLPHVSGRAGETVLVARPVYDVAGAGDGTYRSALICRADAPGELSDFRGGIAAVNEPGSQSGHNALLDAVMDVVLAASETPFFSRVVQTGAHRASAQAVAAGEADIAAIDAVAWALFAELEPAHHAQLRVLAWTRAMPALPFITAPRFADRVGELAAALAAGAEQTGGLCNPVAVRPAVDADYDPIRQMAAWVQG